MNKIGCLLRVALVALVCDKPAAHKIAGYGPTSCTKFCTVCKITQGDLKTPAAFVDGGKSFSLVSYVLICSHSVVYSVCPED